MLPVIEVSARIVQIRDKFPGCGDLIDSNF
jgi:hypothetical protein